MNVLDLFSGIGGFSLGLERAGMETVAFCEIEPFCQKVLAKHWPDVPIYSDIKTLTAERLKDDGITDIGFVCGGVPCQPASIAGKRKGADDDRWLWPEAVRVVSEVYPEWVVFENPTGILALDRGLAFESVLAELETLGYEVGVVVIPACAVDAKHRRDRVWIFAHSDTKRGRCLGGEHEKHPAQTGIDAQREPERLCANVAHAGGEGLPKPAREELREFHRTTERLQGRQFGGGNATPEQRTAWPTEPNVGRVATGVPNRVDRLKALGNAVVPQVVEVIGRAIMETEQRRAA